MAQPSELLHRLATHTRPFWEAIGRHELMLPKCLTCGVLHRFPMTTCPLCSSPDLELVKCSGRGKVYSYVVRYDAAMGFQMGAPNVIAVIELEEGPNILSEIAGVDVEAGSIRVDMPVAITYEDISNGITLFKFRPA